MTEVVSRSIEDQPLNNFHKKLTVYTGGAPFLDGYIMSIVGVVIIPLTGALDLSVTELGLVGAAALVGMFVGGFFGGWLTDRFGHKTLYLTDLGCLALFSLLQLWVDAPWQLILLRFLLGVAVGVDHPLATTLLAEFLPRKHRGSILASLVAVWFLGAVVAYFCGVIILEVGGDDAWRWALASAFVPGVIFMLLRFGTPESPRWLLGQGRKDEAEEVIKEVYGEEFSITDLPETGAEDESSLRDLFRSGYGKRLFFVSVFWACSIIPQFAITAFAPAIMLEVGLTGNMADWAPVIINVMFFLGCVLAVGLITPMGRRPLLIHSFLWSGLALLVLGFIPEAAPLLSLLLIGVYALMIGGAQVEQYVYPNELFPTQIRASAVGFATSASRIGAAIGTYLLPVSLATIGMSNTLLVSAGISAIGLLVAWLMAPETKSKNLHESAAL